MKNKKILLLIVFCVLVVGGSVGFLVWYDKKKKNTDEGGESDTASTGSSSGSASGSSSLFPLKRGSRGEEVRKLQQKINAWVSFHYFGLSTKPQYQTLNEDGIFGPKTESNVNFVMRTKSVTKDQYDRFIAQQPGTSDSWFVSSPYSFLNMQ